MVGALMHIFVSNGEPPLYSMDLIRIPPIIISTVNILLVFFLAKKILGTRTAILSALVYAMLPVIVVSGHLSKDEQLITSFFITALIFAWRDLNKTGTSNKDILLSASFSGLSILAKITGIAIPMTIAGLYISRRQWKKASFFFASTVFFVLIYLGYGALYDFKSLISVLSYQSSIAFSSLRGCLRLITEARLVLEPVNAGWYILLWFSVIYMIFKHPLKSRILAIPLFLYLFFIATAIPFDLDYGWYRIPLYPFLAIGGASLFASFIKNPDFFKGSIITALGILPDFQNSLTQGISGSSNKIRLLVFMLLSPLILKYIISNESYARFVKVWAWLILILSAVLWVFNVRYFTDLYHPLHAF
jgi:4-amino-4-deoxy-L-arabinose transferase-like glycosyltransferase